MENNQDLSRDITVIVKEKFRALKENKISTDNSTNTMLPIVANSRIAAKAWKQR